MTCIQIRPVRPRAGPTQDHDLIMIVTPHSSLRSLGNKNRQNTLDTDGRQPRPFCLPSRLANPQKRTCCPRKTVGTWPTSAQRSLLRRFVGMGGFRRQVPSGPASTSPARRLQEQSRVSIVQANHTRLRWIYHLQSRCTMLLRLITNSSAAASSSLSLSRRSSTSGLNDFDDASLECDW